MLGLLLLDTAFPRIPGDVGCAETFAFPVRRAVIPGAHVAEIVHGGADPWLAPFLDAACRLAGEGCTGIATTCGFLVRWQSAFTRACPVPVLTSSLLQLPLVQATLPAGKRAGVVTYSADDLDADALAAAHAAADTPIAGVGAGSYFAWTIRHGAASLDRRRMEDDTVAAALRLVQAHPDVGAIVLECANMPPYAKAVGEATGLPVFDAARLVTWFYAALSPRSTDDAGEGRTA